MSDNDELPTIGQYISNWLGVQLPTMALPQTIKNIDKAFGNIILALGQNVEARIKGNTAKAKTTNDIILDNLYRTEEERRKLENRKAVIKAAIEDIRANSITEDATVEIDDDWLNLFVRLSEDKSSEELQILFGKLLSGEIQRPGSFSLRTIQLMSTISKQDADALAKLLSYVINGEILPLETGENRILDDAQRFLLEELGIVGRPARSLVMTKTYSVPPAESLLLLASHRGILIANKTEKIISFQIPGQILTTPARELVKIANSPPTDIEFLKNVAKKIHNDLRGEHAIDMEKKLLTIHVAEITPVGEKRVNYNIIYTQE